MGVGKFGLTMAYILVGVYYALMFLGNTVPLQCYTKAQDIHEISLFTYSYDSYWTIYTQGDILTGGLSPSTPVAERSSLHISSPGYFNEH